MKTVFEKIIDRELPATIEYEDNEWIVIHDLHPLAKVHLLLIPKQKATSLQTANEDMFQALANLFPIVQELAKKFEIENSYRLVTNNGKEAGQCIFYLHFHLIGGSSLGSPA